MKTPFVIGIVLAASATAAACATGGATGGDLDATPGGDTDGSADATTDTTRPDAGTVDSGTDASVDAGVDAFDAYEAAPTCVENDAGCITGNPGACGPGILHCDAGAGVCQPVATTQACYSGAASTRNVGICKDGTQSCISTLGPCNGEVLPSQYENCFNVTDDDCNGDVNNGCPVSLSLGGDRPLGGAGGGGGGAGVVHCPPGAFVTRVDSWFDDPDKHASGVSIFCATPSLVQGASSYSVTLTPNAPAPYATLTGGSSPTNERHDDCGITGLTAITYTVGLADNYVEGLGAHCGTSAVTLQANNTIVFNFTTTGDTSYNTWAGQPGTFFNQGCSANEVVVGYTIHSGSWMDNIQPICAALIVNYKP